MAHKLTSPSEKFSDNWWKAVYADKYMKEGLVTTIDNAFLDLQQTVLSDICTQLDISEAKCTNCSTTQICVEEKTCPNGICDILRTTISICHSGIPNWTYTDASKWCTDHWEVAKCFLPSSEYAGTTSIRDIAFDDLAYLAINYRDIQSHFYANINPQTGILSKISIARNEIVHSASHNLTQETLEDYIDMIISVLQDQKELAQDPTAQECVDKLKKLKDDKFQLSDDEKHKIQEEMSLEESEVPEDTKSDSVTSRSDIDNSKDQDVLFLNSTKVPEDTKSDSVTSRSDIDNSQDLRDFCVKFGRNSQEVIATCERIRMEILVCSRSFRYVWPTYKPIDPYNIVFVVLCEPDSNRQAELSISVSSFKIEYRTIGESKKENKEILTEKQLFSETSETDRKNLTDILQKASCHLMKNHSNLNIITASPVKSKSYALNEHRFERKPCIVFYVRLKGYIPIQEEEFPRHLGSYATDVREGVFELFNDPEPFAQRLKIGCSIGEDRSHGLFGGTWGTLGAFVNLKKGTVGCITCAHVILNENNLFSSKHLKMDLKLIESNAPATIYQPAPSLVDISGNEPFGRVTSVVYKTGGNKDIGVEAVLITIVKQTRYPDDGRFPMIQEGLTAENQPNFMSGKLIKSDEELKSFLNKKVSVYKYGAKTGLTMGEIRLEAGVVRTDRLHICQNCELHNQIEICTKGESQFADHGDSGALVLASPDDDPNDLHAIGILSGGSEDCTKFYVTPIWEVLNALALPLKLKNFNEQIVTDRDDNVNASLFLEIDDMKVTITDIKKHGLEVEKKVDSVTTKMEELGSEMKAERREDKADLIADRAEIRAEMKANSDAIIAAIQNKTSN